MMRVQVLCLLFLGIVHALPGASRIRYDGYKLLEVKAKSAEQEDALRQLLQNEKLDWWKETRSSGHVLVSPGDLSEVTSIMRDSGLEFAILRDDIQQRMDAQFARLDAKMNYDPNDFNDLDMINEELFEMADRCSDGFTCTVGSIGQTLEGRETHSLTVTKDDEVNRPVIWLDATIHAREWLATSTLLNIMDHLTRDYESDTEVAYLLDTYDFHFVPVVNPDGYDYTWTDDRNWRKNRNTNENTGSECFGVDLNRNFDEHWSVSGSSDDPCSNTYHGESAASEVETQNMQRGHESLADQIFLAISFHTYGNMWMHPWGWEDDDNNCAHAEDHDDMYAVAEAGAVATMAVHDTVWTYGNLCEVIYPASGTTVDYGKGGAGIKYSYTPELRGDGFDATVDDIWPSYDEVWAGLTAMIRQIENQS